MTEQQFKEFAERIVSEDVTRPAMRSAFRYKGHSIVTDARIALVVDTAFESLPEAADGQESLAVSLVEQMLPDIRRKICDGKYGAMPLDADLLARAAAATAEDLASDMDKLRHHEADPDDPDDVDSEDSERYVLSRETRVIMPDERRHVIAGYYAGVVADMCKFCGPYIAYADLKSECNTLRFDGEGWAVVLQPIRICKSDESLWFSDESIADARTGKVVHRRGDGDFSMRALRFPKEGEVAK